MVLPIIVAALAAGAILDFEHPDVAIHIDLAPDQRVDVGVRCRCADGNPLAVKPID